MAIEPYIRPELTFIYDDVSSRDALFQRLCQAVDDLLPEVNSEQLEALLQQREEQRATSTPEGVAFRHALLPEINDTLVAVALVQGGVDFGVSNHPKCDLIFCLFGSTKNPWRHVRTLARMARILHTEQARASIRAAQSPDELYQRIVDEDQSHG